MADYYPLIARAVAGLDKNTGENRRVLYERARGALLNQLRSVEPPLEESEVTRERLALEEAVRKVEAEAARRARADNGDAQGAGSAAPAAHDDNGGAPGEPRRASLSEQGLRGFRDVVAEAEGLGGAAAEANRSAREFYEAVPDPSPHDIPPQDSAHQDIPPQGFPPQDIAPHNAPPETYEYRHAPPAEPRAAGAWTPPADSLPPYRAAEHVGDTDAYVRPARSYGRLITIVLLLLVLAAAGGAAYWQRAPLGAMLASWRSHPVSQPREAAPAGRPKITDRVGGATAPNTANAPAAAVAQKVVLYDEDPSDPQGKRYVGSAIWRTETVSPGPGLAPEFAVRADVEIPERHMRMTWSLRRNTDKALPASHTIEIMFTLPADFPEGGIANVPGVLMKTSETARGVPLAGLAVKVTNGYFLIGLSAVDVDVARNIDLLKTRDWFDIPIVYTSGKRAILAMEKGTPGARAFEEAFRAWGE
jgi:hypothetical protein